MSRVLAGQLPTKLPDRPTRLLGLCERLLQHLGGVRSEYRSRPDFAQPCGGFEIIPDRHHPFAELMDDSDWASLSGVAFREAAGHDVECDRSALRLPQRYVRRHVSHPFSNRDHRAVLNPAGECRASYYGVWSYRWALDRIPCA
jgi:hypothetical protein